jgi:glycosyltransferase involved in cell wall biosynthesis
MSGRASASRVVALLPAWNAERFIEPVLACLAAQTHPAFEVLISDDASTDRTAAICATFARAHPNVHVIRQPRNLGWIGNVNALLREARGDLFFFAFHDDLVHPAYVERLAGALDARPAAVLAFSDMVRRVVLPGDVAPGVGSAPVDPAAVKVFADLEGVHERLARGRVVARKWGRPPSYSVMLANRGLFRAAAARAIGGLRRHAGGEFGADWPWLLRLALLGDFVRVASPLVEKCYRPTSLSATWRHSLRQRAGLLAACHGEVARAGLPTREALALHRELLESAVRRQWWTLHKRFHP